MSGHYTRLVALFVFLLAIGMAAKQAPQADSVVDKPAVRGLASIPTETKEQILFSKPVIGSFLKHTQKIHGPVRVQLNLVGPKPESPGDVFVVQGTVTTSKQLERLTYQWSLPKGVSLVNGEMTGALDHPDNTTSLTLTLRSTTNVNQQIHLIIGGTKDGMTFAEGAQYNTVDQTEIEATHKALMESTREYTQGQKLKIYH